MSRIWNVNVYYFSKKKGEYQSGNSTLRQDQGGRTRTHISCSQNRYANQLYHTTKIENYAKVMPYHPCIAYFLCRFKGRLELPSIKIEYRKIIFFLYKKKICN